MGNGFQDQVAAEQKRVQSEQISEMFQIIKGLNLELKALKKEVRNVREDLRNLNKLRPLRPVKEDGGESEEASE